MLESGCTYLVESSVEHRRLISWTSVLLPVARLAILLLIRETGLNRVLRKSVMPDTS